MTTAADLLREMKSFVPVDSALIEKAEESGISDQTNRTFSNLVFQWGEGLLDEDPSYVVSEIEEILS